MIQTHILPVDDPSMAGEARRNALRLCEQTGVPEHQTGQVALVTTELATNLAKHAHGGRLFIRALHQGDLHGIELLSIDHGPGMQSVAECMRDGYSTAGSPGTGLGAVQRNSTEFDIYSQPGVGTVVMSRHWILSGGHRWTAPSLQVGAVCVPISGEEISGDSWAWNARPDGGTMLVADGLGHGLQAADSSQQAVRLFQSSAGTQPAQLVTRLHQGLRGTRGCALAVADICLTDRTVRYCGIGNVCGRIVYSDDEKNMITHNGTAGYEVRKIQEFHHDWLDDALLVMHSDGLTARWRLDDHPLLNRCHVAVIAGLLYRDYARSHDDATVVVVRQTRPPIPVSHEEHMQ